MESKINFVCPQCSTTNRVPKLRISDKPICAKCKSRLTPDHSIELNDQTFQKFVSKNEVPVVVDFWASWCGPCRAMAPSFEKAASRLTPQVLLAKLNTESSQVASQFNIAGIPCLIAFVAGREIARQAGQMNEDQIVQWVNSAINT